MDASGGTLRVKDKAQWVDFPYDTLKLETTLNPKRIDTQLNFRGGKLGELLLQAQINPLPNNKPITGTFSLRASASFADIRITAAAPSLIPDALPAVTVPSFWKAARSFATWSSVVP